MAYSAPSQIGVCPCHTLPRRLLWKKASADTFLVLAHAWTDELNKVSEPKEHRFTTCPPSLLVTQGWIPEHVHCQQTRIHFGVLADCHKIAEHPNCGVHLAYLCCNPTIQRHLYLANGLHALLVPGQPRRAGNQAAGRFEHWAKTAATHINSTGHSLHT